MLQSKKWNGKKQCHFEVKSTPHKRWRAQPSRVTHPHVTACGNGKDSDELQRTRRGTAMIHTFGWPMTFVLFIDALHTV